MKVAAICDLNGLGENVGPAVACDWTPPSLIPQLLPWLAVLALLALPVNRTARAWAIWLPLGLLLVASGGMAAVLPDLSSDTQNLLRDLVESLAFGMAVLWLVAPYLSGATRFPMFLKMLLTQGGVPIVAYVVRQEWGTADFQEVGTILSLGVTSLVLMAALSLAGFNCRRRYQPVRLLLWLGVWLAAGFTVVLLPFALPALAVGGVEGLTAFGVTDLIGTAIGVAVLLPFLVLAFSNRFYRERLCQFLRFEPAAAPPVSSPAPASTSFRVDPMERTVQ